MPNNLKLSYDYVSALEIEDAHKIELEGFPESEAATIETLRYRQKEAPQLFLGVYLEENEAEKPVLIGYVCSTALKSPTITHECMTHHDPSPEARTVAIHSLVTREKYRRQGVATSLLREYNSRLSKMREDSSGLGEETPRWDTTVLLAHDDKIKFYEAAGFYVVQKSNVVHGPREWYQLATDLSRNLLARSYISLLPSSSSSASNDILVDQNGKNKYGLVCPFRHCTSTILLPGKATLVSHSIEPLLHKDIKPTVRFPDFPPSDGENSGNISMMWSVPSPLTFENIGFSRDVGTNKYLSCADCDCGPLGWHDTGGADLGKQVEQELRSTTEPIRNQFLLSLDRVRYVVK